MQLKPMEINPEMLNKVSGAPLSPSTRSAEAETPTVSGGFTGT